ncbi:MAG: hypothetical protein ACFE0P_03195 [Oceanicaulis sp.]
MSAASTSQSGYALTEVLVAAAIAGAVLAAGMTAFAESAKTLRAGGEARETGLVARNIEARLRAGLPPRLAVEGYDGWRVELSHYDLPAHPDTGAVLSRARVLPPADAVAGRPHTFLLIEDGAGRSP